jgi:prepilin-type N-terminal cleavage/methylation domain-containing protein
MIDKSAFTLVELAIVIVIIGLLVGGVLTGQELIKASERNRAFAEIKQYESAIITFKGKFNGLPGDFINARRIWGTITKSGNGDSEYTIPVNIGREDILAWQHLSLAKLLKAEYNGAQTSSGYTGEDCFYTPGINVPESALGKGIGFQIHSPGVYAYGIQSYSFKVAKCKDINNLNKGIFTPYEAMIFDTKFDDGKPAEGRVIIVKEFGVGQVCVNDTVAPVTFRNLDTENKEVCHPHYMFNP